MISIGCNSETTSVTPIHTPSLDKLRTFFDASKIKLKKEYCIDAFLFS